jgi:predicted RNase H-like HicB family nuclease
VSESLRLNVVYEDAGGGWLTARVPQVPGAISQGRSRAEARANLIDALRGILELRFGSSTTTSTDADSDTLELHING